MGKRKILLRLLSVALMPIGPARMPLLDHLGELRRRLIIIVVSVLCTACVIYCATPVLIQIMIDPIRSFLPTNQLMIFSALGGFTIRFRVSLFFSIIVCCPIIIWEIMAFFLPALTEKERKWVVPTIGAMVVLFFFGMFFCYMVIQRVAFEWMLGESQAFAQVMPDANDYLNIMMLLEIGFGLAFQLPLVIFYLAVFHLMSYARLRKSWRYVYISLLVLSAVVTPDASPVTMFFMFAVLVVLYEIALVVARYTILARDGKDSLRWTREQYVEHKVASEVETLLKS